jgi:hypothetical protein
MKDMSKPNYLVRRNGIYHYRRRIPADLSAHYGTQEVIKRSLRTTDPKVAYQRVKVEDLKQEQEFAEVRRKLNPEQRTSLSEVEIQRLAALWLHRILDDDDTQRIRGLSVEDQERAEEVLAFTEEDLREALAGGDFRAVRPWVDSLLEEQGVRLSKDGEAYRRLCLAILKAEVKATDVLRERLEGRVVDTPPAPAPLTRATAPSSSDNPALSVLFDKWAKEHEGKLAAATIPEFGVSIRRFVEVNGDLPVRDIKPAHVRDFKDALLGFPRQTPASWRSLTVPQILEKAAERPDLPRLSPRTINDKMLGALGAVLNWGRKQGYCDFNAARDIKTAAPRIEEEKRTAYTVDDLNTIFRFPIFTAGERPGGGGGEAAKWLPLLGLFTGARLEELGQLLTADVKEEDGVNYLDLFTIPEGQRRKNQSSRRRVPVHPELVRLGFLAYVQERREDGDTRLFPDLRAYKKKHTHYWSRWWGRYARSRGIKDTRKTFHSFRHAVKLAYRLADVPEVVYDALQGHTASTEGRKYGGKLTMHTPIRGLAEVMAKLQFPGLDLEHLKVRG